MKKKVDYLTFIVIFMLMSFSAFGKTRYITHLNNFDGFNKSNVTISNDILIDNNIEFKQQKYFKKWLGRQSLDFYIKEKNIAIECQGLQHFKNERRYQNLELVQERDRKKKLLCKENNVHLIYYLPAVFAEYMDKDDIFFTDVSDLVEYIKKYKQ